MQSESARSKIPWRASEAGFSMRTSHGVASSFGHCNPTEDVRVVNFQKSTPVRATFARLYDHASNACPKHANSRSFRLPRPRWVRLE